MVDEFRKAIFQINFFIMTMSQSRNTYDIDIIVPSNMLALAFFVLFCEKNLQLQLTPIQFQSNEFNQAADSFS